MLSNELSVYSKDYYYMSTSTIMSTATSLIAASSTPRSLHQPKLRKSTRQDKRVLNQYAPELKGLQKKNKNTPTDIKVSSDGSRLSEIDCFGLSALTLLNIKA